MASRMSSQVYKSYNEAVYVHKDISDGVFK